MQLAQQSNKNLWSRFVQTNQDFWARYDEENEDFKFLGDWLKDNNAPPELLAAFNEEFVSEVSGPFQWYEYIYWLIFFVLIPAFEVVYLGVALFYFVAVIAPTMNQNELLGSSFGCVLGLMIIKRVFANS